MRCQNERSNLWNISRNIINPKSDKEWRTTRNEQSCLCNLKRRALRKTPNIADELHRKERVLVGETDSSDTRQSRSLIKLELIVHTVLYVYVWLKIQEGLRQDRRLEGILQDFINPSHNVMPSWESRTTWPLTFDLEYLLLADVLWGWKRSAFFMISGPWNWVIKQKKIPAKQNKKQNNS